MLLWPQEIEKFKWRPTGKAKCDMLYFLFKANEDWEQQFYTKDCLYQPMHNFIFPAWVIFLVSFCPVSLSLSTGLKNISTIMLNFFFFLFKEILINLDLCKAPPCFTTSTSATKSGSWMVMLTNGFISYLGLWKIRYLLALKNNLTKYTCPDLKVPPLGTFRSFTHGTVEHPKTPTWL